MLFIYYMEKLGYILTNRKVKNTRAYVGIVDKIESIDLRKPLLIVGLNNAKKYSKGNFSILEKHLYDDVYWTFEKNEKRDDYEKDINSFYKRIISHILINVKYYYIDILKLMYSKAKKLYQILVNGSENNEKNYIYIINEMIYLLHDGNIFGISLKMLRYCGINVEKVMDKIKSNENNVICCEDTNYITKLKRDIGDKTYIIPYFLKLEDN